MTKIFRPQHGIKGHARSATHGDFRDALARSHGVAESERLSLTGQSL